MPQVTLSMEDMQALCLQELRRHASYKTISWVRVRRVAGATGRWYVDKAGPGHFSRQTLNELAAISILRKRYGLVAPDQTSIAVPDLEARRTEPGQRSRGAGPPRA